jgi:hypothetical protein
MTEDSTSTSASSSATGTLMPLLGAYRDVSQELSALAISSKAARVNWGDNARLRWNIARCLAADAEPTGGGVSRSKPELRVLVVGCSMTQGFMNCGSTTVGKQCTIPCDSLAWYRVLERSLQRGLPGCQIKMFRTTSRGGRTVTTAQRYETRVRRANAHIIITDLTVCDLRGVTSSLDEERVRAGWETLIRRTMSEESAPALVHVESWAAFSPMGACRANKTAHRLHLPLAQTYGVPVTSFMMGVCAHEPGTAPTRHWRGGCSANASTCGGASGVGALDTPGFECEPHPGPHTHRVFALLVAELLLGEAKRMALPSSMRGGAFGSGSRSAGTRAGAGGGAGGVQWLRRAAWSRSRQRPALPTAKPPPLDLSVTPAVMPASLLAQLSGCHSHHGISNPAATLDFAESSCGEPTGSSGWRCYEDRPGKRGWISEGAPPPSHGVSAADTLTFAMPLGNTKLTIAYLRSYDPHMGAARLWLDDDEGAAILLNGSWASRTSQTDITSERMQSLCKASCQSKQLRPSKRRTVKGGAGGAGGDAAPPKAPPAHAVHVQRVTGSKFKLLLLEAC